jgi:hypothetical protein
MFVIVEILYGNQGRRERKRECKASTIWKYITSMKEGSDGRDKGEQGKGLN